MDGSTGDAGRMVSSAPIAVTAGTTYTLSYQLAGNHRDANREFVQVQVNFGSLVSTLHSLSQNDPFTTFTNTFTATSNDIVQLSFEGAGGDNIGMLLDNVKLESVPEPGSLTLVGLGLLGLARLRRQRR